MSSLVDKVKDVTGLNSTTGDHPAPGEHSTSSTNPTSSAADQGPNEHLAGGKHTESKVRSEGDFGSSVASDDSTSTGSSTLVNKAENLVSGSGSAPEPNSTNPLVNPPGGKPLEISPEAQRARHGKHGSISTQVSDSDAVHDNYPLSGTARRSRA